MGGSTGCHKDGANLIRDRYGVGFDPRNIREVARVSEQSVPGYWSKRQSTVLTPGMLSTPDLTSCRVQISTLSLFRSSLSRKVLIFCVTEDKDLELQVISRKGAERGIGMHPGGMNDVEDEAVKHASVPHTSTDIMSSEERPSCSRVSLSSPFPLLLEVMWKEAQSILRS